MYSSGIQCLGSEQRESWLFGLFWSPFIPNSKGEGGGSKDKATIPQVEWTFKGLAGLPLLLRAFFAFHTIKVRVLILEV